LNSELLLVKLKLTAHKVWIGIATILVSLVPPNCQSPLAENLKIIEQQTVTILFQRRFANEIDRHLGAGNQINYQPSRSGCVNRLDRTCYNLVDYFAASPLDSIEIDRWHRLSAGASPLATETPATTGVISIAFTTKTSVSLSRVEQGIITEMNRARANPPAYERVLLSWRSRFSGKKAKLRNRVFLQTQEGTPAIDEAIRFLRKTHPVSTLQLSRGLILAARDHVRDQGVRGTTGHYGSDGSNPFQRMERYGKWLTIAGENIAYGPDTAQAVVRDLIIDDGVRDRGHRTNMFQPKFRLTGVACGYHRQYRVMCDIKYAGGFRDR
jgi:uncharacterized protein YkwD